MSIPRRLFRQILFALNYVKTYCSDPRATGYAHLNNEAEFPLLQFQITKAIGRVVGFWDELDVFNVLFFDPLHNIQPAADFNFQVNPCSPQPCHYSTLLAAIEETRSGVCPTADCPVNQAVRKLPGENHSYPVTLHRLDSDVTDEARRLILDGRAKSMQDIILTGVAFILDQATQNAEPPAHDSQSD